MVQENRLFAIRAGRDDVDGGFDLVFDELDVVARVDRQLFQRARAIRGLLPARQFGVDRFERVVAVEAGQAGHRARMDALVAHADFDRVEAVEYVQLRQADAGHAVDADREFDGSGVEPAAATLATGGCADFLALREQRFADGVEQFGREGTAADACRIGLRDAQHVVEIQRAKTGAGSGAAGGGVGRGHKRVGTVVDVEQRTLRAFEQDVVAVFTRVVQQVDRVVDPGADALGELEAAVERLLVVDRVDLVILRQHEVVVLQHLGQFFAEMLRMHEFAKANAAARDLVFVRGTDAATGGADLVGAFLQFARLIERNVVWEDQGAGGADFQVVADNDALRGDLVDFLQQRFG